MGKESGGMRALMRDYGCSGRSWFFSSFVILVSTAKEMSIPKPMPAMIGSQK